MRRDIVKMLEGEKDITNAIVLTHNIDFVFIQSVVLPALRRCGNPTLTIFADAQCAVESYQNQHMALDSLGTRFRVVPVAVRPGFRFHPKAILLSGQQKAVLMVGSGNLTFGGWRENAEAWCRFDNEIDGTAPFAAFWRYLESVVGLTPLRDCLTAEVNECFEPQLRTWARGMAAPDGLFGRPGTSASLLEQMRAALTGKSIKSLLVNSPYFDDNGLALMKLGAEFNVRPKVAVQRRRSGLRAETAKGLADQLELTTVNFQHRTKGDNTRTAFIHAKWYAFEHEDSVSVFLGSANCSQAALTIPGSAGNAELMALINLSKEEFELEFTAELEFIDGDPELTSGAEPNEEKSSGMPKLYLSAARLDQGCLQVAYSVSEGITLQELVADGITTEFSVAEPGVMVAQGVSPKCRQVYLQGSTGSEVIKSNLLWVDHEQALSTTARSRSVVDAVRAKVQSQNWNIGAWADIANVFFRNLQYMPSRMTTTQVRGVGTGNPNQEQRLYTAQDVFSDTYRLPTINQVMGGMGIGADDRVTSLRQLLLRWFGHKEEEVPEPVPGNPEPEPGDGGDGGDNGDGTEVVDVPEKFPVRKPSETAPKLVPEIRASDRRRALEMLNKVTDEMSSESYLSERQLETMSVDIQFASVLFRTALCESWITEDEFFNSTHKIWSSLFFTSRPDPCAGWLEYRFRKCEDPEDFVARMASSKLTAALAAWAFAVPDTMSSPEHVRFFLAQVLSVARLPWLWEFKDGDEIAKELQDLLVSSTDIKSDTFWKLIESKWVDMMRCGHALKQFESALSGKSPFEMKGQIVQTIVQKGELLWQGVAGICVATEVFDRSIQGAKTPILFLQKSAGSGVVVADFAIPFNALLVAGMIPLADAPRTTLMAMLDDVAAGL